MRLRSTIRSTASLLSFRCLSRIGLHATQALGPISGNDREVAVKAKALNQSKVATEGDSCALR